MRKWLPLGSIFSLLNRYANQEFNPTQMVQAIHAQIQDDDDHVWIDQLSLESLLKYAYKVEATGMAELPLYGVPFAIKDNIDLAGVPTTAGCPAFSYTPQHSAVVVQKLIDAGAIPIGKTNMDQFATGLNGTRSPYGPCRNAFNPEYISGGSSSGSAVAVAKGQVCFGLGTDTAGSGRVPAAFNNLIGYKPTPGIVSTRGIVPACRSLDCVSFFTLNAADAQCVLDVVVGYDDEDIYSRKRKSCHFDFGAAKHFRFGVPYDQQLQFFGNTESEQLFKKSIEQLQALGGEYVEIDFNPFIESARLLYEGPCVAERYAAIQSFFKNNSDQIISPVREIIAGATQYSALDAYQGFYRLRQLKRQADHIWNDVDCLVTPTSGTIYTIRAVQQNPVHLNSNLGYYTNFMNLLGYAAVAVPAGFQNNGLPFGITLAAPANYDQPLLRLAKRLQQIYSLPLGAIGIMDDFSVLKGWVTADLQKMDSVHVAVCGAHLSGLRLNGELTGRKGRLVTRTLTSSDYKLFVLPDESVSRPGLVRAGHKERGYAIEVEIWELPIREFGYFVAGIPAPLGIGTITLKNGEIIQGFLCERYAVESATDISELGGWRNYLNQRDNPKNLS